MQTKNDASKRAYSKFDRSLGIIAAAIFLGSAVAVAGTWNPTASDSSSNTAAGTSALATHGGYGNTALGKEALFYNDHGNYNTATGLDALFVNTIGTYNTANGWQALFDNDTGIDNTAIGVNALHANTAGSYNTASGVNALFHNDGNYNTASGVNALFSNQTGLYNTATGGNALYNNTASENTAFGYQALNKNTTGGDHTAIGVNALYSNTTGKQNTAVGVDALFSSVAGSNNVAVGFGALKALAGNGSNNIALGTAAGSATTSGSNNIYIGSPGGTTENSVTRIGKPGQTAAFIAGIAGVPLSGASVVITSGGRLGVVASSARYKMDIRSLGDASDKLARLRPVSYRYKAEPEATHYGLIAEEVDKVMPELVVRDEEGRPESVQYLELIPLLLQERQELRAEIAHQSALIEQQAATLAALRRTLDARFAALDR